MPNLTGSRRALLNPTHPPMPFLAPLITGSPSIGTPTLAVS